MKRKMFIGVMVVSIICLLGFGGGCESDAGSGALLGGAAGAGIGALAGRDTKSTLIGAGLGAALGGAVGAGQDRKKTQAEMDNLRQEMNTVTVNITNSNNSISQVGLRKQGVGYVGPNGEYYDHVPTAEELEPIYAF